MAPRRFIFLILATIVLAVAALAVAMHITNDSGPPQITADIRDPAWKAKQADANHKAALEAMKDMEIKPKDDFCTAWRPIIIGLPIAPGGPNWDTELIQQAASGNAFKQEELGMYYFVGNSFEQNYSKAYPLLEKAASQGRPGAQAYLGEMYLKGLSVKSDPRQAYFWLSLSTIQGQMRDKLCRDAEKRLTPETISQVHADVLKRLKTDNLLK